MQTVLVIDDDAMNLRMAEFMLKQNGFNVLTAENGHIGIDVLNSQGADLVLLDIEMPEYNGFDALTDIKADSSLADTPVIMLTASAEDEDIKKSTALGAVDYIKKPFKPQELFDCVSKYI